MNRLTDSDQFETFPNVSFTNRSFESDVLNDLSSNCGFVTVIYYRSVVWNYKITTTFFEWSASKTQKDSFERIDSRIQTNFKHFKAFLAIYFLFMIQVCVLNSFTYHSLVIACCNLTTVNQSHAIQRRNSNMPLHWRSDKIRSVSNTHWL